MTSQNIDLFSWDTLYELYHLKTENTFCRHISPSFIGVFCSRKSQKMLQDVSRAQNMAMDVYKYLQLVACLRV
jgi:hypothetical protein